ncbi:IST1-like protein [Leguminivora glycinivorella]|uniref:IST1-like protein n=1 Tax=Leguminivora glycinivorella TaxID=1035111 RepID=UPI002010B5ED|nr:IST1-like protein [Leguminivora glycinivorella]
MKYATACLLAIVGLSSASVVLPLGQQPLVCPPGTQLYSVPGCGYVTREPSCYDSRPRPDRQQTCGYSACHCAHPTVRNDVTGQCVHFDKCPNAKIIHGHGGGGRPRIEHRKLQKGAPIPGLPRNFPELQRPKAPLVQKPVLPSPVVQTPVPVAVPYVPAPVVPKPVAPTPVVPLAPTPVSAPAYNSGYTNYNSGYSNENTGYTNYNTGYANNNNGNAGYSNYNTGYRNSNNGYSNYNSGYNNNAVPLRY